MNINRENCEAWFLDYYEGNLSEGQVQDLFAFLILHPDMREVFDSYDAVSFDPDQLVNFDAKESLKKTVETVAGISETNYEEYCVGSVEGTLSAEEEKQLEIFLAAHPEKRDELELLRKMILEPEAEIVFEAKASLKKTILVTEENFAEYAVAYVDGTLEGETLLQFENFVAGNPALMQELALFGQTKLQPDTAIVFEDKASLKRKALVISETNFEEFAIASLEGQLSGADEKAFAAYVAANPAREKTVALYAKTKVQPDTTIVFEEKESLRRKKRGAFYWMSDIRFAAAAAVALLIGIFWWANNGTVDPADKKNDFASNGIVNPKNPDKNNDRGTNPLILPKPEKNTEVADLNSTSKVKNYTGFVSNTTQPEKINERFVSLDSRGNLRINQNPAEQKLKISQAAYQSSFEPLPASSPSISAGQFAMRWMKNKLDQRPGVDEEDLPQSPIARDQNENQNVSGFDLTSSAVNRLSESTGANLHLGKSDEGTVLTFGKYDILLSRNR